MLYVEPYGGLCNRMRCMSSACRFAEKHNIELTIIWSELDELNCDFKSLFSLKCRAKVRIITIPNWDNRIKRYVHRALTKFLRERSKKFLYNYDGKDVDETVKDGMYILSFSNWFPTDDQFGVFELQDTIKKKVGKIIDPYQGKLIGVHIRRTDNKVSIEASPTELFCKKIQEIRDEYPDCKLYVASDESNEIERITDYFGSENVVTMQGIERSRNTKKGIIDAATELYILANCRAIVGSYYSSFTDTAAAIRNIPKYIVKQDCKLPE